MPLKTIKTSYNAGELSEYMAGRTDINKYHNGCSKLINATVLPHGGVVKRPGTEFIGKAPNKCRLIPFEFSVDDALTLEFSNLLIRFYKDGARVYEDDIEITSTTEDDPVLVTTDAAHGLADDEWVYLEDIDTATSLNDKIYQVTVTGAGGVTKFTLQDTEGNDIDGTGIGVGGSVGSCKRVYQIVSPYTSAQAFGIHVTQSADVMFIAYPDIHPQKLSRYGDTDWTIEDIDFVGGPYLDENIDTDLTLTFTHDTHITGTHTTGNNSATLIDDTKTWTTNEHAGKTVVNTTDGCFGIVASNTADTITFTGAGLANGTDDDFDEADAYEIIDLTMDEGFYHSICSTGTLEATGHTPFVDPSHVGSVWQLKKTRNGDNYVTLIGTDASSSTSSSIRIKGDYTLNATGFGEAMTVTLERKEGDGDWQDWKKFTAAISWTGTEDEDNTFYRINVQGTDEAGTNVTLTAENSISNGEVEITTVTDSNTAVVKVTKELFRDVDADIQITSLRYGNGTDVLVKLVAHGLSNGDIVLIKQVSRADFTGLNYDADENNVYVISGVTADTFRLAGSNGDVTGNAAEVTTGVGEYYVLAETSATSMWSEGAWSDYRGFPRTLTFFEDRLWWASTTNNPDTLWGSKSSDYENMEFSEIGLDDDALNFPLNDNEVSQIQWMNARQVMAIGAANKEYRFGASDIDKPVTPSDRKVTPQTAFGSDNIQPVILNNAIFFFQRQGRKLRAMTFDAITENFAATDATLLANTLFESAPTCMAVQRVPDSIIWVVRTDGVLLSFTYEPDEEVAGWARHITQNSTGVETPVGFFESVAVIHGSVEDEVWVSVRRIINTVTVRYVERFATRFFDEIDEAMMLDSAVVVSSVFTAQEIVLASDTVRCGEGLCNSSLCGGVVS